MVKRAGKDRKKMKKIIELLFFIPLIIIALVLYYFIDNEVSNRMVVLKADILSYLEKQLGRKIRYNSISPSVFMYLEIRDLKIFSLVSNEEELFRIKNLKIKYNIFKLLFSQDALTSVSEINISNTLFKFKLTPSDTNDQNEFLRKLLNRLTSSKYTFKITAHNVGLHLYTDTVLLNCTNLFFIIKSSADVYDINLRKGTARVSINRQDEEPLWFFSKLKTKGTFNKDLTKADLIVHILHLSSNNFILEKQTFQLIRKDESLQVVKIQDKAPLDLELSYNFDTRELGLNFETENWKPSQMVKLTGSFYSYNPWLDSLLTSNGAIAYGIDTENLNYTLSSEILLNNPILPPDIRVTTYLYGDKKQANFKPLVVQSNLGTIDFTGDILFENFFPQGFLRLVNVKAIQDKRISADFSLNRSLDKEKVSLERSRLYIGSSGFDSFKLEVFPGLSHLNFDLTASFAQSSYDDHINAQGKLIIDPALSISVDGSLEDIPVAQLYKLFSRDASFSPQAFHFLQRLTLGTEFLMTSDFKTTEFSTESFSVLDQINKENYCHLSVVGTEKEIAINSIDGQWEHFDLKGNVNTRFEENDKLSFTSALYLEDIPYGLSGTYFKGKSLIVQGNYGLNLSVLFSRNKDIDIIVSTLKLPFPISGHTDKVAYTSFYLKGTWPRNGNWHLVSPGTIFYDFPLFHVEENECEISFVLNKDSLIVSQIMYKDFLSELSGYGEARFGESGKGYISSILSLSGKDTKEYYSLSTFIHQDELSAHFVFTNSPLERIGKYIIKGSLSGNLTMAGSLDQPDINGSISLVKGRLLGDHVGLETDFQVKGSEILFNSFELTYLALKMDQGQGRFNKNDSLFEFSAIFEGDYFRKHIYSALSLKGQVIDMGIDEPLTNFFKKEINGRFDVTSITVDNKTYDPWTLFIRKKGDVLDLDGGPGKVLYGKFFNNGEFRIELTEPFPIRGLVTGNVKENILDSVVQRIWIDFKVFNIILGEEIIKFTQGFASGENIKVSGYFNDPDFTGSLLAQDVALSFFLCPLETAPFQCKLTFTEKQFEMNKISTTLGSGIIFVDKGIFYMDHWLPAAYDLTFRSDEEIGIYCSYDFDVVKVKGYAIGTVNTRGDKNTVWVDGNILTQYCTITMSNPGQKKSSKSESTTDLRINLSFESGRKVEFDWPTSNFPVLKCFAEKDSQILMTYESNPEVFNMTGQVAIKGGEVFYFNRNFYLKSGNIVFNVVDPEQFDPMVSVRAELRESENDEMVKIYLIAENNRLSEFSPRFESVPSLSEYDIYRLLGKSLEERFEHDQDLGLSFVLLSSEVLTEALIFRNVEQTIRDIFNLDLFSIRTHIIENILIDKVLSEVGSSTEGNPISLGTYLDNTTITMGQYIGDDLFVSALVRLREVDYYTPETLFGSGFFGIEPELEFSLEWPTPFFNLEWTFNPTQDHSNDLFFNLTDNTIKFEWSFSY